MSDNEGKSQVPQSTTFGAISILANHPLVANLNESEQPEPKPNEIITNIIKDANKVANQKNYDSDNEDNQQKMNGFINDLQSKSITPDDNNLLPRKSITSGRLIDTQENSSTPAIIDSSADNPPQGPIRSMSESALIDHHDTTELPSTLPIQQDENSTDGDDFQINNTNRTFDDDQQPLNTIKQNDFDKTARYGTTSRTESAASKRSPSASGDEKRTQLPDETGTDTDRDNQEVANISRRPSRSKSPLNRPRSPTPDDPGKTITNAESHRPQSSSLNEQKQDFEPPTAVISSGSRRESINKIDNRFESSTNESNNDFLTTNEQSKLIKPGEQLQIPINDTDNEQTNSPPSTLKQMALINPLLENSVTKTDQDNSRPSSETNRQSPTSTSISNAKIIDGDVVSSKSRPSSNTSQQGITITDQKPNSPSNRRESIAHENNQKPNLSSNRRESIAHENNQKPNLSSNRRESIAHENNQKPNSPSNRRESIAHENDQKPNLSSNRRESTAHENNQKLNLSSDRRGSVAHENNQKPNLSSNRRESIAHENDQKPNLSSNRRESIAHENDQKPNLSSDRRGSVAHENNQKPNLSSDRRGSVAHENNQKPNLSSNRRESIAHENNQKPNLSSNRRESIAHENDQKPNLSSNRRESIAHENDQKPNLLSNRRGSVAHENDQKPNLSSNRRESITHENNQKPISSSDRRGSIAHENNQKPNLSSNRRESIAHDNNQKPNLSSDRRGSVAHENNQQERIINKNDSRRSSTDADVLQTSAKQKQERILSNDKRQSPLQKRSEQQSEKNSNLTTDQTVVTPIKINPTNKKRLSTTDSNNENLNTSKLPRVNSASKSTTPTNDNQTTKNEIPTARPQSPNVEQIAEHNQFLTTNKKKNTNEEKNKEKNRSLRRSNSAESFNRIPLVDEKSLDSATESESPKQRRVKSKKKDVETNTDSHKDKQQQESTSQKPLKATKPISDHPQSTNRRLSTKEQNLTTPDTEPDSNRRIVRRSVKKSKDSNEDKDPVNVNVTVLVKNMNNEDDDGTLKKSKDKQKILKSTTDHERHTQSDTEQIISEKQKKRRRPKRISRTTQTYECVFRRMEREEHQELHPTSDTDKNIQTRQSRLRPRTRSPRKHYPTYLSNDSFKIEEILPKQFSQTQQNISKTSIVARSTSPSGGKLLILRPTLPFHHTDAVNVQRISLQYAIELVPNQNKSNDSITGQRNKSNAHKQSEQTNNLPMIHSSSTANVPTNKSNMKDKSIENRTYQRKNGGNI